MKSFTTLLASIAIVWGGGTASAEILAMMNYESKTPDQVKALKLTGPQERREGIAIINVDPESAGFGKLLVSFWSTFRSIPPGWRITSSMTAR
jgi:hypothetical protein